jgi:hypothetical protein
LRNDLQCPSTGGSSGDADSIAGCRRMERRAVEAEDTRGSAVHIRLSVCGPPKAPERRSSGTAGTASWPFDNRQVEKKIASQHASQFAITASDPLAARRASPTTLCEKPSFSSQTVEHAPASSGGQRGVSAGAVGAARLCRSVSRLPATSARPSWPRRLWRGRVPCTTARRQRAFATRTRKAAAWVPICSRCLLRGSCAGCGADSPDRKRSVASGALRWFDKRELHT